MTMNEIYFRLAFSVNLLRTFTNAQRSDKMMPVRSRTFHHYRAGYEFENFLISFASLFFSRPCFSFFVMSLLSEM